MASWLPCLVVLMLGTIHSAQIASSNQQVNSARVPSIFVRFDDIVSHVNFKEPAKNVYKREISDDFTIGDESNFENASSDGSPFTADNDLTLTNNSSAEVVTEEVKEVPLSNELDTTDTNSGNEKTSLEQVSAANEETVEKTIPKEVATVEDYDSSDTEMISDGNMVVGTGGGASPDVLGKLMADEEGSGDDGSDGEGEVYNPSGTTVPDSSDVSKQLVPNGDDISDNKDSEESSTDISIDSASEETVDPPDETPIPDPLPEIEDSKAKDFKEDELIGVSPEVSVTPVQSASEEIAVDVEGSGEGAGGRTDHVDSEESVETKPATEEKEPPQVPFGRNFMPTENSASTEQPSQTEPVPQEPDDTEDIGSKKAILPTGVEQDKEGMGMDEIQNIEDDTNKSSTGSYIVLGAIMMTIVVLVAYTVVKSRRQKKSRRSGSITKANKEDPGREMKEVDKLLSPRSNGFSAPNGGAREDEKLPLTSFKADFNEVSPMKSGFVPDNSGGGLTDVIVENVPRLSTVPITNGNAANDSQSEDDQESWVQGDGKALESTKIKMYIDEDSIPKTPIMIVNRGSTPNEV